MITLGIESSCDDTAAAVWCSERGLLSSVVSSQDVHVSWGGVVPELASRAHHQTITDTVEHALERARITVKDLDRVAVTEGPGLMGSLLVGLSFAKGFSLSHNLPIVGVNHIDAHLYAAFIEHGPEFPFVGLIVSGGHTRLVRVDAPFVHTLLGETRDDAAGEAFDKTGKMLGLPYPAGPEMDRLAREGDPEFHAFPRSMIREGLEFSFSGLKTSLLYYLEEQKEEYVTKHRADICASVSAAITDVLSVKLERAMEQTGIRSVVMAGGVSANSMLRKRCRAMADRLQTALWIPSPEYCTDNGAMIAVAGAMMDSLERGRVQRGVGIRPYARMPR
ncbi:MAG: tRNA (adenosine(37)-N6)-threonylcarbamoyltransferase complex transferase subunit TsaD [Balneolaceae bacterium]